MGFIFLRRKGLTKDGLLTKRSRSTSSSSFSAVIKDGRHLKQRGAVCVPKLQPAGGRAFLGERSTPK